MAEIVKCLCSLIVVHTIFYLIVCYEFCSIIIQTKKPSHTQMQSLACSGLGLRNISMSSADVMVRYVNTRYLYYKPSNLIYDF